MKYHWIFTLAILAGKDSSQESGAKANQKVTVFLAYDERIPHGVVFRAISRSSQIFAGIGVEVQFCACRKSKKASRTGVEIEMTIEMDAPAEASSGALALAHPFRPDGRIRVFYSRLQGYGPKEVRDVMLAYILTHEISHVLQGLERHSATGLMKAGWSREDFMEIVADKLVFDARDIELIKKGINLRMDAAH